MNFEDIRAFLEQNHRGVVTTHRPGGAAHSSIVVCGAYRDCAAFVSVHKNSVKVRNLRRDPRCTVLAVTNDWRSSVTVDSTMVRGATLRSPFFAVRSAPSAPTALERSGRTAIHVRDGCIR